MSELNAENSVAELVAAAKTGDDHAWETLVRRYQPLIVSVARRFRLSDSDAEDVSQTVWLQLVSNLDRLREPRALPGWIETTTANTCLALLKALKRTVTQDPQLFHDIDALPRLDGGCHQDEFHEGLLRQESRRAVQRGLAELSSKQQQLLLLLAADPPLSYQQISDRLDMPMGSIGPTRARCVEKLRQTSSVRGVLSGDDPAMAA